jgi:hypothetical protein
MLLESDALPLRHRARQLMKFNKLVNIYSCKMYCIIMSLGFQGVPKTCYFLTPLHACLFILCKCRLQAFLKTQRDWQISNIVR